MTEKEERGGGEERASGRGAESQWKRDTEGQGKWHRGQGETSRAKHKGAERGPRGWASMTMRGRREGHRALQLHKQPRKLKSKGKNKVMWAYKHNNSE